MKTKEEAIKLAKTMEQIGRLASKETVSIITNMNEPVGKTIGNTLEIIETIECLKGDIPEDIKEIITTIGAYIIKLAGKSDNLEENKKMILQNIQNGKAYKKFLELVENQSGDISYIENPDKLAKAKYKMPLISERKGYVKSLNAEEVGIISVKLGAGRVKKEDKIDNEVRNSFK